MTFLKKIKTRYKVISDSNKEDSKERADFHKYVPIQGPADTLHGEILRATNRIGFRFFNDGDFFFEGYGAETAGPAANYLESLLGISEIPQYLKTPIKELLYLAKKTPQDDTYQKCVDQLDKAAWRYVDEVEEGKLKSYPNHDDMLSYDEWEREDDDEYDYEEIY